MSEEKPSWNWALFLGCTLLWLLLFALIHAIPWRFDEFVDYKNRIKALESAVKELQQQIQP